MPVTHSTLIALTAGAGLLTLSAGELLRRHLNTLTYRRGDEENRPWPGARRWIPWTLGVACAVLVWHFTSTGRSEHLIVVLPFTVLGAWVAGIDVDVQRIPYALSTTGTGLALAGVSVAGWLTGEVQIALSGLAGGLLAYLGFRVSHALGQGRLGYGDVRYAASLGLVAGSISLGTVWLAVLVASLLLLVTNRLSANDDTGPFGPWLWVGTVTATALG